MSTEQPPTIWIEDHPGDRSPYRVGVGSSIVGRDHNAGLAIESDHVSSHHAELYWDGERLRIRDLGSLNGTSVNGRPVVDWVDLRDGDVIRFGTVEGVVEADSIGVAEPGIRADDMLGDGGPHPIGPTPGMPVSQVPIFVSHSSEDKTAARTIARYLERRGWRVWIDEAGIAGGKDFHGELIRALESTWVVLLVVSFQSMRSRWVTREVQAADRLGLRIIPVVVEEAPYPDELRMILTGVQQIPLTERGDRDRRNQQLSRLDHALVVAAQSGRRTKPGRFLVAVGSFLRAIGAIGALLGFALFAYLGFVEVDNPSFGDGIPAPFIGWAVFAVFIVIGGIGEAMRRAGLKKGI